MKLELEQRIEFGKTRYYPAFWDGPEALILTLMGRRSFTREQLERCQEFGWEIKLKANVF